MPDHVHLFAGVNDERFPLDNWVRYWKSLFTRRDANPQHEWQAGYWDTTLRGHESYESKWEYVRGNPVRHQLVEHPEDWEFQGVINELPW